MMFIISIVSLFLLFLSQTLSSNVQFAINLDGNSKQIELKSGDTLTITTPPPKTSKKSLNKLFNQLYITVEGRTTDNKPFQFPFHSVKGVSTDDSHSHFYHIFGKLIKKLLKNDESTDTTTTHNIITNKSNFLRNFIRDIFSSCPSPLFGDGYRQACTLTFSPYGNTTLSVIPKAKKTVIMTVRGSEEFNSVYMIRLIIGILFLSFAPIFAKSKYFQVRYMCTRLYYYICVVS